MTREELAAALGDIDRARADRIEVWRYILDVQGREVRRIYRGYMGQLKITPHSYISTPHTGETS